MNDALNRIGQFLAALALVLLAMLAALTGYYLEFCPGVPNALAMGLVGGLLMLIFQPQLPLYALAAAAVVAFVIEPFGKTPRRRRIAIGYVVALGLLAGGGAIVATRDTDKQCNIGLWH